MKGPDKIYVNFGIEKNTVYKVNPIILRLTKIDTIEYIRKDVILNLLKSEHDIESCDESNVLRNELIEKINSL